MKKKISFQNYIRALRLPFITATILPFIAGSLLAGKTDFFIFFLGFVCACATHLGANLINDYADSRSGADWKDKRYYGFFGGSKLIQEGKIKESFYLEGAKNFFFIAFICAVSMAIRLSSFAVIIYYLCILFLGFSYSHPPLKLSYRHLGELTIFILFGPALVMGAYYLQTGEFPAYESFLLAVPFGFFIVAILFANEVADYAQDKESKKYNLVGITGVKEAFRFYFLLVMTAYIWLAANIVAGKLSNITWLAFLGLFALARAGMILRRDYHDKERLVESSRLTIMAYNFFGIMVIAGFLL